MSSTSRRNVEELIIKYGRILHPSLFIKGKFRMIASFDSLILNRTMFFFMGINLLSPNSLCFKRCMFWQLFSILFYHALTFAISSITWSTYRTIISPFLAASVSYKTMTSPLAYLYIHTIVSRGTLSNYTIYLFYIFFQFNTSSVVNYNFIANALLKTSFTAISRQSECVHVASIGRDS